MSEVNPKLLQLDRIQAQIIDDWYARVKEHYVTEEESRELGVEPELKFFHEFGNHRIKFARKEDLDVTYGLGSEEVNSTLRVISSVNNKSAGFDYDLFVERLKSHYWRSRYEKPWMRPGVDHLAYEDLLRFEPRMGQSVSLDIRKEKADIVRLYFDVAERHESLLSKDEVLMRDLLESYCLYPLQRIYAEAYREQ